LANRHFTSKTVPALDWAALTGAMLAIGMDAFHIAQGPADGEERLENRQVEDGSYHVDCWHGPVDPKPARRQPQTDVAPKPSRRGAKPKSMPTFSNSCPLPF